MTEKTTEFIATLRVEGYIEEEIEDLAEFLREHIVIQLDDETEGSIVLDDVEYTHKTIS